MITYKLILSEVIKLSKQVFLLAKSKDIQLKGSAGIIYDYDDQISYFTCNNTRKPAISYEAFSPTQSKTMAEPGDDDPDDGRCF